MMAPKLIRSIVLNFSLCLLFPQNALADSKFSKVDFSQKPGGRSFQQVLVNPGPEVYNSTVRSLLTAEGPTYNWPSFPRTWLQVDHGDVTEVTGTAGFAGNIGVASVGLKTSVTYSYGHKVSLVVISSLRPDADATGPRGMLLSPEQVGDYELTKINQRDKQRYFAVRDGFTTVGFCSYEMMMRLGNTNEGGASFFGNGGNTSYTKYQQETRILFTNFFKVREGDSVQGLMAEKCEGDFLANAKKFAEASFEGIVQEYHALYNPLNECKLTSEYDPQGDRSCAVWHKSLPMAVRNSTVARCEVHQGGVNRCVAKTKKGASCTLYKDRNGKITDRFQLYGEVTPDFGRQCDEKLVCTLDREPLIKGGFVLWKGAASCK